MLTTKAKRRAGSKLKPQFFRLRGELLEPRICLSEVTASYMGAVTYPTGHDQNFDHLPDAVDVGDIKSVTIRYDYPQTSTPIVNDVEYKLPGIRYSVNSIEVTAGSYHRTFTQEVYLDIFHPKSFRDQDVTTRIRIWNEHRPFVYNPAGTYVHLATEFLSIDGVNAIYVLPSNLSVQLGSFRGYTQLPQISPDSFNSPIFWAEMTAARFDGNFAWLIHGYKPPTLDWEIFRSKYESGGGYYRAVVNTLSEQSETPPAALPNVTALPWASDNGWNKALLFTALKAVTFSSSLRTNPLIFDYRELFDIFITEGLSEGKLESYSASRKLKDSIIKSVSGLLSTPSDPITVTLFGHSRGGEVAARTLSQVRQKLDSLGVATQLFLLDAYGTDWPGISSFLGTDAKFPVGRTNDYNVRVSAGLSSLLSDNAFFSGLVRDVATALGAALLPETAIPANLKTFGNSDWMAPGSPARDPMKHLVEPGSNHITVTDRFFARHDLKSLVNPKVGGGAGEGTEYVDVPVATRIRGGLASQLIKQFVNYEHIMDQLDSEFSFAKELLSLMATPQTWLHNNWAISGRVELNVGSPAFAITDNGSSMSQFVMVPPRGGMLRIDGLVLPDLPSETKLEVLINGELIGSVDKRSTTDGGRIEFALHNDSEESQASQLTLRQVSSDEGAKILFTDVAIEFPTLPKFEVVIVNRFASLKRTADSVDASMFGVHLESNGVEGLQSGVGGDVKLVFGADGSAPLTGIDFSGTVPIYVLATYVNSAGQMVYEEVPIRNTALTNLKNPVDTNLDGQVSPIDALLVINALNRRAAIDDFYREYLLDSSMDGMLSPIDALLVINVLNRRAASGEGENTVEVELGWPAELEKTAPYDQVDLDDVSPIRRKLLNTTPAKKRRMEFPRKS